MLHKQMRINPAETLLFCIRYSVRFYWYELGCDAFEKIVAEIDAFDDYGGARFDQAHQLLIVLIEEVDCLREYVITRILETIFSILGK